MKGLLGILLFVAIGTAAQVSDHVQLGNAISEQAHQLRTEGRVTAGVVAAEIGMLKKSYRVQTVSGKESAIQFDLSVAPATAPVLLEIQEIHQRRPDVFGYSVLVNGKEVYFRTYEEMGAGPNHYFVQFDRALVTDGKVQVALRNAGEAPFSVGQAWVYSDFFALAKAEEVYRKMTFCDDPRVLLNLPKYDPEAKPGMTGEAYTNQLWATMKQRFEGAPYRPGSCAAALYAFRSESDTRAKIDAELRRAGTWNLPSQFVFIGSEWGGHPYGPDGLGGYFGDVKYSSIRFDPVTKTFRTSWPDSAGGVTWPTWNDPQLNRFLAHRMARVAEYYQERRAFLKAHGQGLPTPLICQEWGLSVPGLGDWNDATVEAARRDGVTMKPGDKLGRAEKMWIHRNLAGVPTRFAEGFRKAAGRDCVLVDRGEIHLPEDQLDDQYYFHTFYPAVQPLHDDYWAGWQTGVGPKVWTTGETGPHVPFAYYDYVIGLGKLATVNLERGFFRKNLDFIQTLYELGFQWVTPCNTQPGDADLFLPQAMSVDGRPCMPALHCERKILDVRFLREEALGPTGQVARAENITITANQRHPYQSLMLLDPTKPGCLTYRLTNDGRPFDEGLTLKLIGSLADGDENSIEVAVGKDMDSLRPVRRLLSSDFVSAVHWPWTRTAVLKLGDSLRGQSAGYLQLALQVKNKNTVRNLKIEELRVSTPWEMPSGHVGGEPFTVKQRRTLRLWIQDRAVLERIQADYRQLAGEDDAYRQAADLAAQGRCRSAYRLLAGEISQVLPARFAVRGHGKLGRYPVTLDLRGDDKVVLVELAKAGPGEFEFALKAEQPQPCTVRLEGLKSGERYALQALGPNRYRVSPANGELKAVDGRLALDLTVQPVDPEARKLPRRLSGVFLGGASGTFHIDTQEPDLWMDNPIVVPVATDAVQTCVQDGAAASSKRGLRPLDKVELVIDESGTAREIRASYGVDAGRIKVFHPPVVKGETSNGIIELENGRRYELGNRLPMFTKFEVPGVKPHYRNNRVEELVDGLKTGLQVDITYCPYTYNGRLPRALTVSVPGYKNPPSAPKK